MREVFFKAKRFDNGEWIVGYIAISYSLAFIIQPLSDGNFKWHNVDPNTVCQYTGRVDKDGRNIWENDILVAHLDDKFPEDETYEQVIWHDCGFHTKDKYSDEIEPFDDFTTQYFAVAGNIFDDKELLERKE